MRTFLSIDEPGRFWSLTLEGRQLTVERGRRGSESKSKSRSYSSAAAAKKACARQVSKALAEGFVEVVAQPGAPLRQALEEVLVVQPDDLAAHKAYADYLTEQSDPRGEFIAVQLALEDEALPAKERKRLQKRERELLEAHAREWLGALAGSLLDGRYPGLCERDLDDQEASFRFVRGWLDTLEIKHLTVQFARALAQAPEARLLRRLVLHYGAASQEPNGLPEDEDMGYFEPANDIPSGELDAYPALFPLARSPYLSNVRSLQIGEAVADDGIGACYTLAAGTTELVANLPRLEELRLFCWRVDTERLFGLRALRCLRVLQVYHLSYYPLFVLAANPALGRLTHLLLHPHALEPGDEEAYISSADLLLVARSPHLRSLTHLRLRLTDAGDEGCEEIVQSGVLKRLKVLDLRHGCITDKGARLLARCPDLKNLELLDVGRNALTAKGAEALRATGVPLKADAQHTRSEVAERRYLYEGDCE
jgi:uncharacterized protein (TIGR02996 family)